MEYRNSSIDFYYANGSEVYKGVHCIVEITSDVCVVRYDQETGVAVRWEGKAKGAGHYELQLLTSGIGRKRATLHRFAHAQILEGFGQDQWNEFMWRIHLKEQ
jgi:hypothetical protein